MEQAADGHGRTVSERLRALMADGRLSDRKLAEALTRLAESVAPGESVSKSAVAKWRTGEGKPSDENARLLGDYFGVPAAYFTPYAAMSQRFVFQRRLRLRKPSEKGGGGVSVRSVPEPGSSSEASTVEKLAQALLNFSIADVNRSRQPVELASEVRRAIEAVTGTVPREDGSEGGDTPPEHAAGQ